MRQSRTSGSVGAAGEQSPVATQPGEKGNPGHQPICATEPRPSVKSDGTYRKEKPGKRPAHSSIDLSSRSPLLASIRSLSAFKFSTSSTSKHFTSSVV